MSHIVCETLYHYNLWHFSWAGFDSKLKCYNIGFTSGKFLKKSSVNAWQSIKKQNLLDYSFSRCFFLFCFFFVQVLNFGLHSSWVTSTYLKGYKIWITTVLSIYNFSWTTEVSVKGYNLSEKTGFQPSLGCKKLG